MAYNPADGFNRIMPGLHYEDVAAALEWLGEAFRLREHLRWTDPETGTVRHAEMRYGSGAFIELSDGPENAGVLVIVDDVDAHYEHARASGAKITSPLEDKPWGLRQYAATDPERHMWGFAQWIRDVRPEEWGATTAS
jgi:uncharacterized glyoxalase superfamily protein PhnB